MDKINIIVYNVTGKTRNNIDIIIGTYENMTIAHKVAQDMLKCKQYNLKTVSVKKYQKIF